MAKTPDFDYTGPNPFHHIAWSDEPIEVRLAWAQQVIAAGHDLNRPYAKEPGITVDSVSRPLAEMVWSAQNYNADTGRLDDIELVKLYLAHGADPRLRDRLTGRNCIEEAAGWEGCADPGAKEKYWKEMYSLMKARADELDSKRTRTKQCTATTVD
ncbi:uncharacterized protein PG998_011503 [Apiospora kogelbergensis]|uniref:Ankyrin repeat-containing protein n=1 Tax=Apiospora kogelbergensis TaxID=1337665 RepID=A0AAW0RBN5_9PEZI